MSRFILFSLFLLPFGVSFGQTKLFVKNGCAVNESEMGGNHYVFEPDSETVMIINAIMDINILQSNFVIRSGDVGNAIATVDNNQRIILYNTAYIERIKNSAGTDWAAFFVFAHEIGHHLNNHQFDLKDTEKMQEQELQADIFAGGILYRLGASLEEAQQGVAAVVNENESKSHPPKKARLAAIANGWKKAKGKNPGLAERFVLPTASHVPPSTDPLGLLPITGGTFTMGCTSEQMDCSENEKPSHKVTVSDFYLGEYEVTQQLWLEIMGNNPSRFTSCGQCPVEKVSWEDVQGFLKKLNTKYPGYNYRLPTEAEWEYAAREGGKVVLFGNGKNMLDPAEVNFDGDTEVKSYSKKGTDRSKTVPVGSFLPNALGLYDMSGNVWEWCSDWYGDYFAADQKNPSGPKNGIYRVLRGGSWSNVPKDCRVPIRLSVAPGYRIGDVGFRLARSN